MAPLPDWYLQPGVKCVSTPGNNMTAVMYPSQDASEVIRAKSICNGMDGQSVCPVRMQCLKHAIDYGEKSGVWGGTSERDRRKIWQARIKHDNPFLYLPEDLIFPHLKTLKPQPIVFIRRRPVQNRAA